MDLCNCSSFLRSYKRVVDDFIAFSRKSADTEAQAKERSLPKVKGSWPFSSPVASLGLPSPPDLSSLARRLAVFSIQESPPGKIPQLASPSPQAQAAEVFAPGYLTVHEPARGRARKGGPSIFQASNLFLWWLSLLMALSQGVGL